MIYIVKGLVSGQDVIKVGDTKGSIAKRVDDLSDIIYNMELLHTFKEKHIDWFKLEQHIHRKFKSYQLSLKVKFLGYTEFYPTRLLKEIVNEILNEKKNFYISDVNERKKFVSISCPLDMFYAAHWINEDGNTFPVSFQCKGLYMHHLSRYKHFKSDSRYYTPSISGTSRMLGIPKDKVKSLENLLAHMNLLVLVDGNYVINDLSALKGSLNPV